MAGAKWNRQCAFDVEVGQIPTEWISYDFDVMPHFLENANFFQDTNMAAVIEEERSRGDHHYAIRHELIGQPQGLPLLPTPQGDADLDQFLEGARDDIQACARGFAGTARQMSHRHFVNLVARAFGAHQKFAAKGCAA